MLTSKHFQIPFVLDSSDVDSEFPSTYNFNYSFDLQFPDTYAVSDKKIKFTKLGNLVAFGKENPATSPVTATIWLSSYWIGKICDLLSCLLTGTFEIM